SFRVPSAMETYATRDPSGDIDGHCSAARSFVRRDSVPSGKRTQSDAAPSRPRTKMMRPSRPTDGCASGSGDVVNCSGSPTVGPTTMRQRSKLPDRSDENTMDDPSALHDGSRSQAGPDVSCVHCPALEIIHRSPRTLTASRPSRAY